jgi:hypothetical protein
MLKADFTATDEALTINEADQLSRSLVEFWWALQRRRNAPPTRGDIDPYELRPWIGRLHLWEATDDGDFICRIWGTLMTPYTNRIWDGMRVSQQPIRPYREVVRRHFRAALERGEPTIHRVRLGFGGHSCDYERTVLPLAAGADTPPMLLNLSLWDARRMRALFDEVAKSDLLASS